MSSRWTRVAQWLGFFKQPEGPMVVRVRAVVLFVTLLVIIGVAVLRIDDQYADLVAGVGVVLGVFGVALGGLAITKDRRGR